MMWVRMWQIWQNNSWMGVDGRVFINCGLRVDRQFDVVVIVDIDVVGGGGDVVEVVEFNFLRKELEGGGGGKFVGLLNIVVNRGLLKM